MTRRLASVPDQPKKAGLYVRVSAVMGRSDETFRSPDLQLDAIRRALPALGAIEGPIYSDIDRTGTDFNRDGITQAITDAKAGEIDLLVTYDLARFGRNVSESLEQIKALRRAGVPLASTVERFDDSPEGQFMLTQFLALAELYAKQIGRRWSQLRAYRFEQGMFSGGVAPMGYCRAPVEGAVTRSGRQRVVGPLLVDPVLAPAVRAAFEAYASGVTIAEVCRRLSAARGRPTARATVKAMLRNPVYVGKLQTGGRVGARDRHVPLQIVDGIHEAIVSDATWRKVQARLDRDARTPSRSLAVSHSLATLARCAVCGYRLTSHVDNRGARRLECRADAHRGCVGIGRPRAELVEAIVLERCWEYLAELRVNTAALAAAAARRASAKADLVSLRAEVARTEGALGRLTARHFTGALSDAAYKAGAAELERTLAVLFGQLDELESSLPPGRVETGRLIERMLVAWPDATAPERNLMLKQVVVKVVVVRAAGRIQPMGERVSVEFV